MYQGTSLAPNLSFNGLVQRKVVWIHISWSMCTCSFLCLILALSSCLQVTPLNSYQGHGHGESLGEGHTQVHVYRTQYCECLSGQQHQPTFSNTISSCSECSVRRQKVQLQASTGNLLQLVSDPTQACWPLALSPFQPPFSLTERPHHHQSSKYSSKCCSHQCPF